MSTIQQLQELVGDLVDSGSSNHIPGQQQQQQLGTTEVYPVMHNGMETPPQHSVMHDITPTKHASAEQCLPTVVSQSNVPVLERQPSFFASVTIPESSQSTVLIPEVASGPRQPTANHTQETAIRVSDIPDVKPPKVPPKVAPKPNSHTPVVAPKPTAHTPVVAPEPSQATKMDTQKNGVSAEREDAVTIEQGSKVHIDTVDVPESCYTDMTAIQDTGEPDRKQQDAIPGGSHTEPHYLNNDQMPQPLRGSHQIPSPTPQVPKIPYHMQQELPPPYQSNPNTPEVHRSPCRFHANMLPPSPYHSNSNTPGLSRVPCHRFTHTFEDDSYSLNSTLTSLEVGHLQSTHRTPCQVASSSLESQFRLPINERGLFLQDSVFERSAPILQSALREVLGRGWGPGRHTTMADEMVRYRNMRAGDVDGRTQVAVITRTDTYYLIVVDMHEYLEGSMQLKVGGCCSVLVEGWLEIEEGDEIITYDFNRCFPTPDMAELKDISADLSSDGILCITVPTIPLDDISYRPGPRYNDSSYEPLVDIDLHRQNSTTSPVRSVDNRNPRYAKYLHDSHHQDPSLQPLVNAADTHGHNTAASSVRLESPGARLEDYGVRLGSQVVSGQDRQILGEGADENSYTYKSCRSDSVSSNRPYPVVC